MEPQIQGHGGGVLLWSCITEKGSCYGNPIIDGAVKSKEYVKSLGISLIDTLDHFDMTPNAIHLQQNNAIPYASTVPKQWFSNNSFSVNTVLYWLLQSPNLNPLKRLRYQLQRRLNKYRISPTTKEELADRIEKE